MDPKEINKYEEKIKKYKKIIEEKEAESITLKAEGKHLMQEKEKLTAQFQEYNVDPKNIEEEIAKLEINIKKEIEELNQILVGE